MEASITWTRSPAKLAEDIAQYGQHVTRAMYQAADELVREVERDMKRDAPWNDESGEARRQLSAQAFRSSGGEVSLTLSHGVDYGVFLEFANAGQYAIVGPTLQRMYPELESMLQSIFG